MPRVKISHQALILFILISVTPVIALNLYWLSNQQNVLRDNAEHRQALVTESAADRVNGFMSQKIKALILHSQSTPILKGNLEESRRQLTNYIKQDQDIEEVTLLNKSGQSRLSLKSDDAAELRRENGFDTQKAHRVATFLGGKEYISPVKYINNEPYIQIAVPVLTFSKAQDFSNLSTSERGVIRSSEDINGALIITTNLSQLWNTVFQEEENSSSFSYIVDEQRHLIGHPEQQITDTRTKLSDQTISGHLTHDSDGHAHGSIETTGINDQQVLATHATVPRTSWWVITEEPIENVSQSADEVARTVWTLNIVLALLAVLISYLFSRRITAPIRKLVTGANEIGNGKLDTRIDVKRKDELGTLAQSLNSMSQRIKALVEHINTERHQLDVVLNSINEGVFALDKEGKVILANSPALELFNTHQINGREFKHLTTFKQEITEITIDVNTIEFKNNVAEFKDLKFVDADNKERFVDVLVAQVPQSSHENSDDKAIEYLVTIIDQTSSRELEAMKIDFVSMAAHELRTPLTAIRGYMELILNDKNSDLSDKFRQYLLQGYESTVQLSGLINNLLNVSKIERNALQMSKEKMDLSKLVASSVRNQQFSAEKSKLTLKYTGPDSGIEVVGDKTALREVIDNLITNALHYTPEDGMVTVSVETGDDDATVSIADTGIGIPEEARKKLFTKFFRVHGGLATGSGGSGLGLYISKSIVESHNGKIWAESTEGKGSTFSFTLPLYTEERHEAVKSNSKDQSNIRREHGWVTKNSSHRG